MNDPPTTDLGTLDAATRMRLENVRYPQRAMAMDVRTILAAYDAQAARLAAMDDVVTTTLRWHAAISQRNAVEMQGGSELQAALEELLSAYHASVAATARYRGVMAAGAVEAGEARDGD